MTKLNIQSHTSYKDGGSVDLITNSGYRFHINRCIASLGTPEYEQVYDANGPVSDELAKEVLLAEQEYLARLKENKTPLY